MRYRSLLTETTTGPSLCRRLRRSTWPREPKDHLQGEKRSRGEQEMVQNSACERRPDGPRPFQVGPSQTLTANSGQSDSDHFLTWSAGGRSLVYDRTEEVEKRHLESGTNGLRQQADGADESKCKAKESQLTPSIEVHYGPDHRRKNRAISSCRRPHAAAPRGRLRLHPSASCHDP